MVEFGAEIKLNSGTAMQQMKRFANQTSKASSVLKEFQEEVKKSNQGLGSNTFKKYIDSSRKLTLETKKNIAAIQDQTKTYSKLTDEQKELVSSIDKLNQKYNEAARNEAKLIRIKKELQQITGAGLQTKKEELRVFKEQSEILRRSTTEYKKQQKVIQEANAARRTEAKHLRDLRLKYDKLHAIKVKERKAQMELNLLVRKGAITGAQYTAMLEKQRTIIAHTTSQFNRLAGAQSLVAKTARLVSIYSRVFLGLYAAARIGTFIKDMEETAQNIDLLQQKLEFLTGDSGGYKKLFDMTQEVGIEMAAANKIITRFAVVTNRAFSVETMSEWSATLIKSARATGTSTQEMSGALIQITQAMSAGRLMGDEYRSVTENLPLLTVALRDMFSKSTLSLKELSSQGLITNDVMVEAFGRLKVLLEGFPDSTDTIEASIGRLSSAWDNFIASFLDTDITKSTFEFFTYRFNVLSQVLERQKDEANTKILEVALLKLRSAEDNIDLERDRITKLKSDRDKTTVHEEVSRINKQIKAKIDTISALEDQHAAAEKRLRELSGNTDKDLAKRAADQELQRQRKLDKIYSEQLKTLQLIDRVKGGKSIYTINKKADLDENLIERSNDIFGAGGVGLNDEQYFETIAAAERARTEAVDKAIQSNIDAYLRIRGYKTRFNEEEIRGELVKNSKLLEIQENFDKRRLEIQSGIESRRKQVEAGKSKEKLTGFEEDDGNKLIREHDLKAFNDSQDVIDAIINKVDLLGESAKKTSAVISRDKLGLLGMAETGIVANFDKDILALRKHFKELKGQVDVTNLSFEETYALLEKAKNDELFAARRAFEEKLEDKYSAGSVAVREHDQSIKDLNTAKVELIVSDKEYILQQRLISEEYENQTRLAQSLTNELSGLDQIYGGLEQGALNFMNNTETAYEHFTNATEEILDGTVDLMLDQSKSGTDAFKAMINSMIKDMAKFAIKRAIYMSFTGAFGGTSSSSSVAPGGTDISFNPGASDVNLSALNAKGNVFSGNGISAFSGSTVSKPTLFPFAKGIGVMGEDGEEAILPLKRGADGSLGVSSGSGGSSVVINNYSESKVRAETGTNSNGKEFINIIVDEAISGMVQNGRFDTLMSPYNVTRTGRR